MGEEKLDLFCAQVAVHGVEIPLMYVLSTQLAIPVLVELNEASSQVSDVLRLDKLSSDKTAHCIVQLGLRVEVAYVLKRVGHDLTFSLLGA